MGCLLQDGTTKTTSVCKCGTATCKIGETCTHKDGTLNTCTDTSVQDCVSTNGTTKTTQECHCGTAKCLKDEKCLKVNNHCDNTNLPKCPDTDGKI